LSRTKISGGAPEQRKKGGDGVPVLVGIDDRRWRRLQKFDEKFVGLVRSFTRERGKGSGEEVPGF
jgi:hypothetical protein